MTMIVCSKRCPHASRKVWCYVAFFTLTCLVIIPWLCYDIQFSAFELLTRRNETELREILIKENYLRYIQSLDVLNKSSSLLHINLLNPLPRRPFTKHRVPLLYNDMNDLNSANGATSARRHTTKLSTSPISDKPNTMYTKTNDPTILNGIAITIITVSRDEDLEESERTHYLTQSVAQFVKILNRTKLNFPVHLSVCNVDPSPEKHEDIRHLPDWLPVYHDNESRHTFNYNALLEKEKLDYIFCMNETLKQNMSYVLMVEDDALPHDDLFTVIETHVLNKNWRNSNGLPCVLYYKLYHPERLLGYISIESERIPELISLALLCAAFLTRIYTTWQPRALIIPTFTVLMLICLCALLFIGRPTIVTLRRLSRYLYQITPAPSCCTPAMLFPRQSAIVIHDYLKRVRCEKGNGKDTAIDKFVRAHGYKTRYIQPNLFRHIGHFSSLRSEFINPYIVS